MKWSPQRAERSRQAAKHPGLIQIPCDGSRLLCVAAGKAKNHWFQSKKLEQRPLKGRFLALRAMRRRNARIVGACFYWCIISTPLGRLHWSSQSSETLQAASYGLAFSVPTLGVSIKISPLCCAGKLLISGRISGQSCSQHFFQKASYFPWFTSS